MLVQENGAKRPAPVRDMSAHAAAAPELDLKTPCKIYVSFFYFLSSLFYLFFQSALDWISAPDFVGYFVSVVLSFLKEISGTPQNLNRVILDYSKKITGNMFLGVEQLEESHEE